MIGDCETSRWVLRWRLGRILRDQLSVRIDKHGVVLLNAVLVVRQFLNAFSFTVVEISAEQLVSGVLHLRLLVVAVECELAADVIDDDVPVRVERVGFATTSRRGTTAEILTDDRPKSAAVSLGGEVTFRGY